MKCFPSSNSFPLFKQLSALHSSNGFPLLKQGSPLQTTFRISSSNSGSLSNNCLLQTTFHPPNRFTSSNRFYLLKQLSTVCLEGAGRPAECEPAAEKAVEPTFLFWMTWSSLLSHASSTSTTASGSPRSLVRYGVAPDHPELKVRLFLTLATQPETHNCVQLHEQVR